MTENNVSRDHQLILKVMRLIRPRFCEPTCFSIDLGDKCSHAIANAIEKVSGQTSMEFPIGEFLMAPQTMDIIYIGETFTFYIAICNEGNEKCTNISVTAEIQTQTQRAFLNSQLQNANADLLGKKQLGEILTYEITEIGQHILVCSVNYTKSDGEKMFLRKFFKFPVNKPIDVKTKFYNTEDSLNNEVYLEAQIQNLCTSSIILENVVLDSSKLYTSVELNAVKNSEDNDEFLDPYAIRQFLFCLTPNITENTLSSNYRGVSTIGVLDISWRTIMGERGRLRTSPLQRMTPGYGDLRLTVEKIPRKVKVQEVFEVVCKIQNCCERALDLVLTLNGLLQPSMIFCSLSNVHLGQILPNNSIKFSLDILPISSGLQSISGIRLTDSFLKRTYEHDEVAQILVV